MTARAAAGARTWRGASAPLRAAVPVQPGRLVPTNAKEGHRGRSDAVGASAANMRALPARFGTRVRADAVTRNAGHCPRMVEEYAETIKPPRHGEEWGCGKKRRKARGGVSRIVEATCTAARFVPVWDASPPKKHDAAALPRATRGVAGPGRWCMRGIRIPDRMRNPDKQEHFNGKFADRLVCARGINTEDAPIFCMAILRHDFIYRYGGIGGRPPPRPRALKYAHVTSRGRPCGTPRQPSGETPMPAFAGGTVADCTANPRPNPAFGGIANTSGGFPRARPSPASGALQRPLHGAPRTVPCYTFGRGCGHD